MKHSLQSNRNQIHDWLRYQPVCIKFIETLAKTWDDETLEEVFQLIADYWRWGGYPHDNLFTDASEEAKHIATHLIYYCQFVKGQRHDLPKWEEIPVTGKYLKCYAIAHGERRRKKSDPFLFPDEYWFLKHN